jgi:hypothetical protein
MLLTRDDAWSWIVLASVTLFNWRSWWWPSALCSEELLIE